MISEIQDTVNAISPEVFIPEFGLFDMVYLEPERKYQGRVYRLSQDQVRILSETLGFTARFDSPAVRAAYVDVIKTEGHITFEVERNAKPTDLNLRYMRDQWNAQEVSGKSTDALRPWIKTLYDTRFLPEKVFAVVSGQLRMDPEELEHFYVRLNLKERTAGLIAEDQYADKFPTQPFSVFALPEGHVASIPAVEVVPAGIRDAAAERPVEVREAGPKYATYSKSEIDRLMKTQADSITNALAGKIGAQQRAFLEAVEAQEKAFAKITEKFVTQFEEARIKLEEHTRSMQENARAELEKLNAQLSKELLEFRSHVNKNILPVSRQMEEKIKEIQAAARTKPDGQEKVTPVLLGVAVVLLIAIGGSAALLYANLSHLGDLPEIKSQLSRVLEKTGK